MNGVAAQQEAQLLAALKKRVQRRRADGWLVLFGLVSPALLTTIWWLTGNRGLVRQAAWGMIVVALVPVALGYLRGMALLAKLKHFRQDYAATVRGLMGPVREIYESRYDYDSFSVEDFETLRVGQQYFHVTVAAFCILAAAYMTLAFFNNFVWG